MMDDAEMKAREIIELVESTTFGPGSNLQHAMSNALREAEARGMMRAAEIVRDNCEHCYGTGHEHYDAKVLCPYCGWQSRAIEQAAAAPTEGVG